jgi:uncharacterized protein (TIGR02246 family)
MTRIIWTVAIGLAGLALVSGQAPSADEEKTIRAAVDSYTTAFNTGDLDGLLSHYAADADYIDQSGKQYKGKADLAQMCKKAIAESKGYKLKTTIASLRFVRPDVAIADGKAEFTAPDGTTDTGLFTAVWNKTGGKWLLTSVRDLHDSTVAAESDASQLQQLEWLVGDWTHDDPHLSVQVSCRWTLNKNFLLLEFTAKGKDGDGLLVLQYFGWDPIEGVIRSCFFDSKGGFGAGDWVRTGNTWTSDWSGVLPGGRTGSSVTSLRYIDKLSFIFHSVDREIDGLPIDDLEAKFVRKAAGK